MNIFFSVTIGCACIIGGAFQPDLRSTLFICGSIFLSTVFVCNSVDNLTGTLNNIQRMIRQIRDKN